MDWLEAFLLERVDEDADCDGKDEGVLNLSELDGLLTAVVSGPETVPMSAWLDVIWGDFAPVFDDESAFEEVVSLLVRHMNDIVQTLIMAPQDFEPIVMQRVIGDETRIIVDEWCEGYMRGVGLTQDVWNSAAEEIDKWLLPITAFTADTDWMAHELEPDDTERLQGQIASNARQLHAYWLARRSPAPAGEPMRYDHPKVGRNDPCPCGSGRKYKKCCLH